MSDFFERRPGEPGRRMLRRDDRRRRLHRRRLLAFVTLIVVVATAVGIAVWRPWHSVAAGRPVAAATALVGPAAAASADPSPSPSPKPSHGATHSPTASSSPKASAIPTPTPSHLAAAPAIVQDLVPYGPQRKAEMAAYSKRHYGQDTWALQPKAIVLHYTATSTYAAAHNTFAANAPNRGELPGVASHFIIATDGTTYEQVPLDVRCRHTIGLNWCAIGIEFVQPAGSGSTWAVDQIFARRRQIDAGLRLVSWLQATYGIPTANVFGHATANSSPLFHDLLGWRNDHVDWGAADLARFKRALTAGL